MKVKVTVTGENLTNDKVLQHLKAMVAKYEAGLLKPEFSNSVVLEITYELKD